MKGINSQAGQLPDGYKPRFRPVIQTHPFDDWAAAIATLKGNKSVDDVVSLAKECGAIPANGPYFIDHDAIAKICIRYGWVSTVYKSTNGCLDDIPSLALVMLDYDESTELGRLSLAYWEREDAAGPDRCVLIDVANWIPDSERVRLLRDGEVSFYIRLTEVVYDTDW